MDEVEIDGKKYEVHVNHGEDCVHSQGQRCAFLDRLCHHVNCCAETRQVIRDVIFVEKQ